MIKAKQVPIASSFEKVDDTHVLMDETALKEASKSFRDYLKKLRNIPSPSSRTYLEFEVNAVQYVTNIINITQALVEQNVIESDPYGFLTGAVTSYGTANKVINDNLIPKANELIQKRHEEELAKKEAEGKEVSTEEAELNPAQVAAIASEPTEDPNTHVLEVFTTTKKRWYFDKINYTLSFKKTDGTIKTIKLAKKGSWRATIINAFIRVISWIKEKYNNAKDRCIGAKQTIQFKLLQMKFKAKQAKEAKQAKKEADAKAKASKKLQPATPQDLANSIEDIPAYQP